jgi:hypothetical protein
MTNRITLSLALLGSLAIAGCGGADGGTPVAPDASPPQPTISIQTTPARVTAGETFMIDVTLTNFELIDPSTTPPPVPAAGEGHYHIYFDDRTDYSAGWVASLPVQTSASSVGSHTIRVVLANSGHEELSPAIEATTTVVIE